MLTTKKVSFNPILSVLSILKAKQKKSSAVAKLLAFGGEGGIRTHGTGSPYSGFRDRLLKPLGHLSKMIS